MTDELMFVPASAADRPAIAALLVDCGLPADDIGDHIGGLVTVQCDGKLIATVGLETYGEVGLLRSLSVTPAWRSNGVANELCRRIESRAREEGVVTLYLLTTTAERFFERRGWRRLDRSHAPKAIRATREFASLCPDSAIFMALRLDDCPDNR
jgi:amino-acid N-acetyltransferase